jgi:hypothetical protein
MSLTFMSSWAWQRQVAVLLVAVAVLSGAALAGAAAGLEIPAGFAAGAGWAALAWGTWRDLLSEDQRQRLDPHVRWPDTGRYWRVGIATLAWFTILLTVGSLVPTVLAGAANVFVVLVLFWTARPADGAKGGPSSSPGGSDLLGDPAE